MLHLQQIKSQASPYWDSLVRIYHTSFPIDEQRPIESIAHLIEHDERFVAYAIVNENENEDEDENKDDAAGLQAINQEPTAKSQYLLGLLTTWHFEEFIYIEHFAIDPDLRSRGYGAQAIKTFIKENGKPIILEAEPPTDDITCRRIRFYERLGLTLYDFPYIQPAYTPESNPVELRLMGTLDTNTTPLPLVSKILHREVYGNNAASYPYSEKT